MFEQLDEDLYLALLHAHTKHETNIDRKALFEEVDKDGSGLLSLPEIEELCRRNDLIAHARCWRPCFGNVTSMALVL